MSYGNVFYYVCVRRLSFKENGVSENGYIQGFRRTHRERKKLLQTENSDV